jgi:hypothetical protein
MVSMKKIVTNCNSMNVRMMDFDVQMECASQKNFGWLVSILSIEEKTSYCIHLCKGDYDCMDWSDEYLLSFGDGCPFKSSAMKCDEHLCISGLYSCGDGQCVEWQTRMAFQRIANAEDDCFNKRNLNYMCELSPHKPAWTLESGLCWPDKDYDDPRWNMTNALVLFDNETWVGEGEDKSQVSQSPSPSATHPFTH